jgi:bacillithiol biosynthesis cysteine-adding enzyme BshC
LLFVDPLDESVRHLAAPLLQDVIRHDDSLHDNLIERGKQLEAAGYHAQVHVEAKTSLVFLLDGQRRTTLRRQNGEYAAKEAKYSAVELIDRAEQLSPNALLRPVVQDYVLPTVAYVGGPAELAYMAQSEVLYRELLGRMPVMVSRGGFTLLDTHTAKLMERYQLTLPAFFHGQDLVQETIARTLVPPTLTEEFSEVRRTVSQSVQRLRDDLAGFDQTLAAAVNKSAAKILYQLSKIERKTARETLKRNERAAADAGAMCGLIFPDKHLQERHYSILPFLAQHGVGDLMDTLYQHVRLECPDHQVLVV